MFWILSSIDSSVFVLRLVIIICQFVKDIQYDLWNGDKWAIIFIPLNIFLTCATRVEILYHDEFRKFVLTEMKHPHWVFEDFDWSRKFYKKSGHFFNQNWCFSSCVFSFERAMPILSLQGKNKSYILKHNTYCVDFFFYARN